MTGYKSPGGPPNLMVSADPTAQRVPCLQADPSWWFSESPALLERAKTLCRTCPVMNVCLAGALDRGEPWGVWGGEIFQDGVVIPLKRRRGRPPKRPVAA